MTQMTASFKALLLAAAVALPTMAFAAEPAMEKDGMFTDHKGMTLYTFAKDSAGKSMCNDKCAANWPPLMAAAGDKSMGDWTVIKRDDGKMQWAYEGKPLYTFVMDKKAGDMIGEGKMDGAWHVAKAK
jgi:predicted lipoprotein with Yx(FWY)xxD motif